SEEVGDDRHTTFFEMLGNFAPTGDYFKEGAIPLAWELVTEGFQLPKERLRVTIHPTDDEADGLWKSLTDVNPEWIYRNQENWWSAGETGPCGPDSELWWDRGPEVGCGQPDCYPDHCERFLEFWNLVFMQYDRQRDGSLPPLPRPGIDTGMGLDRIASILQGVGGVYEIDLFAPILGFVRDHAGEPSTRSERLIADHLRGSSFLLADGVLPATEGRGYVLRRLLRRAALHARRIKLARPLAEGVGAGVEAAMAGQRARSRTMTGQRWPDVQALPRSTFTGYLELETETAISSLYRDGAPVAAAEEGEQVEVFLDETPFYAESGGQVGDT